MKKLLSVVAIFMACSSLQTKASAHVEDDSQDILVFGSRPWDENVSGIDALKSAHFMDFRCSKQPDDVSPATFHHIDANDIGPYSQHDQHYPEGHLAGKLSVFAREHTGMFQEIIIDFATYHHILREEAWDDFYLMLKDGGRLIIPVMRFCSIPGKYTMVNRSEETAKTVGSKLEEKEFRDVSVTDYDNMPEGLTSLALFKNDRGGMRDSFISQQPAFIFASK